MKSMILAALLLCVAYIVRAQGGRDVRLVEVEVGGGINHGGRYRGVAASTGSQFIVEPRINLRYSPLDVGLQYSSGFTPRKERVSGTPYGVDHSLQFRSLVAFVGYNNRVWREAAPFVGLGIGYSFIDDRHRYPSTADDATIQMIYMGETISGGRSAILVPRVGVEFFDSFRLTVEYRLMKRQYSNLAINLGFIFGGGPMKDKGRTRTIQLF